jgi:hypothetical protein
MERRRDASSEKRVPLGTLPMLAEGGAALLKKLPIDLRTPKWLLTNEKWGAR